MRQILGLIGLMALLVSCGSGNNNQVVKIDEYYSLLDLLDEQIDLLVSENATLEKTLGVGEEVELISKTPNIEEWKSELELFYYANINKLGLIDAYETEELSNFGGGKKLINSAKSNEQSVRMIEYNFANDMLESLRILVEEENEVYVFKKEMQMTFTQKNGKSFLTDYSITGTQTMVMKSDLNFSLKAKVLPNT
jgi:hypothetical protein